MSAEMNPIRDPRTALVREKYFTIRPKPLERWIWQQGLPQAAERVFWVHWEEGMRAGDWCSQLSLKRVASLCCVDPSTVTRAYQVLRQHGLIRREDPGRDPANPFQQATAVTEVRVPRELLVELSRAPNRPPRAEVGHRSGAAVTTTRPHRASTEAATEAVAAPPAAPPKPATLLRFKEFQRLIARLSEAERERYQHAWMQKTGTMQFDEGSRISAEEQQQLQWHLYQIAQPAAEQGRADGTASPVSARSSPTFIGPRRLPTLTAARLHRKLAELVPGAERDTRFREVLWSVEEGALRRFDPALAINIALKKLREGAWTRPNRMPPNWLRRLAQPETCSAA